MAWWLFQNVVITAGLALVVAMVCRVTRIGPVARHALWLVVLVKFVTPPLVLWPWAAPDPFHVSAIGIAADARLTLEARDVATDGVTSLAEAADRRPAEDAAEELAIAPRLRFVTLAWPWLLALWALGSVLLFAIEAVRLVRLSRRVRLGRPADVALEGRVAALAGRLGIAPVTIRILPGSAPPAVWCLGRPQVLWPADLSADASDVSVDGVLLHELAHVKRRDHLVGWVELIAGIVWWWNPLFWYVRSALREQAELSCDAWVISTLPDGRRAYAQSLLMLSGAAPRGQLSMAVVGVRASTRRVLERRLAMIMQGRAPLRLTTAGLFSLALVAGLTLPGWAASQNPPPPPPPVPVTVRPVAVPPALETPPVPTSAQAPRQMPPPPPPVPIQVVPASSQEKLLRINVVPPTPQKPLLVSVGRQGLPAGSQELLNGFETDVDAIRQEADQKTAARREALVKALEALQADHTRAGRLDEALAIRDYLRAGLPGLGPRIAGGRGGRGRGR